MYINRNRNTILVFAFAVLFCVSAFGAETNVALLGTATQSTTGYGGVPERAIDGNTNGAWASGTITHTNEGDPSPWWQVDLGDVYDLTRIVIWGRTEDCCIARLSNFQVRILDGAGAEVFSQSFYTEGVSHVPASGEEIDLPGGTEGKIVRLECLGTPTGGGDMFMSLAEVQVFADVTIAPTIEAAGQPKGGYAGIGESFTFSVTASGTEPFDYQWKKDDVDIEGATESSFTLVDLQESDTGLYTVTVSNSAGSVISDPADLLVPGTSLAVYGEASQSTVGWGGVPQRANDGVINGSVFSHTATGDPSPWWEVLLAGESTINSIVLWNRSAVCCWERLSNFRVSVLDEEREAVFSQDFFTDGIGYVDRYNGLYIPLPEPIVGRFVRVEILGPNANEEMYLTLVEVQVFGDGPVPRPTLNLARRPEAVATQSTQLGGYAPSLALDGNFGNFTHTVHSTEDPMPTPWWQVDLGGMHDIATVVIHNRTSCCGSRLRDITVFILNSEGTEVLFESELLNPENELGDYPLGPGELRLDLIEVTGDVVTGGIVRIERTPDPDNSGTSEDGTPDPAASDDDKDILSLGEVEVFGPCPGEWDTNCDGFEVQGPEGNRPGLYTLTAAGSDDAGDAVQYIFTVDNGIDPSIVIGPQIWHSTDLWLALGDWTISATVTDVPECVNDRPESTCSLELSVAGDPDNVAWRGTATQSSTNGPGVASRAIDAVTDGLWNNGSVTHTSLDPQDEAPTWELDLGQSRNIDRIVLWNRTDCCMERLSNFRVSVMNSAQEVVFSEDFFTDGIGYPDTTEDGFEIPVSLEGGPVVRGQYVRVEVFSNQSGFLVVSLAEVQVFKVDGVPFQRGNVNGDSHVDISDAIFMLCYIFLDGPSPACADAGDANDDGALDIADVNALLSYLFQNAGPLPAPSEWCGFDPTADTLPDCVFPQETCP